MTRILPPALALVCLTPTCLALGGCSLDRYTDPQRTATEELLISTAADRAAAGLALRIGAGRKAFLDTTNFEGLDSKYAIGAIRSSLLKQGTHFVQDKKDADTIIEIRAGALSVDKLGTLIGVPSFNLPIPLAGQLATPEIALYKVEEQEGIAKFGATAYDAKDGHFIAESTPPLGRSHLTKHVVLLVSWTTDDIHANDGDSDRKPSNTVFEP